jgi:hypothetical protein
MARYHPRGKYLDTKVSGYSFVRITCDNCRMPSSSCDTLDTPSLTEVTQLLGQKHIFLMAKAKLPIAVCTLRIKYNKDEEPPAVNIPLPCQSPCPDTALGTRDISVATLRRLSWAICLKKPDPSVSATISEESLTFINMCLTFTFRYTTLF